MEPRAASRGGRVRRDALVHDERAEGEELLCVVHRLGEEVGRVLVGREVRHRDLEGLDHVAHEEVAALDVLHAVVVLGLPHEQKKN